MNRLFTIFCVASIMIFHTSCNENVIDTKKPTAGLKVPDSGQSVNAFIQQARQGDANAYYSLALCYRDGNGVEKSWLNMIVMYFLYSQKSGEDFNEIMKLLDEHDAYRVLTELILLTTFDETAEVKLTQLKQLAPIEARVIEAAKYATSIADLGESMSAFREAEEEGSELATIFEMLYYEEAEDKTGYEELLARAGEKYPIFYQLLGELYVMKYHENKDFSYMQKAVQCYYKADAYGALTKKYANGLLAIYDYYGEKGLINCEEEEITRLHKLAETTR